GVRRALASSRASSSASPGSFRAATTSPSGSPTTAASSCTTQRSTYAALSPSLHALQLLLSLSRPLLALIPGQTTHVVATEHEYNEFGPAIQAAVMRRLPVVSRQFI